MIALSRNADNATITTILTLLMVPLLSLLDLGFSYPYIRYPPCLQYGCILGIISRGGVAYGEASEPGRERAPILKKQDRPLHEEGKGQDKNIDKIWCPEGGRYQYVEVCKASCRKIHRCEAYADYREPKLI
jgi:hypothetical protein